MAAKILEAWREHRYILVISRAILKQIEQVIRYPHIAKKYRLQDETTALIDLLEHNAIITDDTLKLNVIADDPDDNKVLACAIESKADYIVSGDSHLLRLRQYKNAAIVTAREFLELTIYK